jgi:hypothetical protein
MTKKLLALYGLKWNLFAPDVPSRPVLIVDEAMRSSSEVEGLGVKFPGPTRPRRREIALTRIPSCVSSRRRVPVRHRS